MFLFFTFKNYWYTWRRLDLLDCEVFSFLAVAHTTYVIHKVGEGNYSSGLACPLGFYRLSFIWHCIKFRAKRKQMINKETTPTCAFHLFSRCIRLCHLFSGTDRYQRELIIFYVPCCTNFFYRFLANPSLCLFLRQEFCRKLIYNHVSNSTFIICLSLWFFSLFLLIFTLLLFGWPIYDVVRVCLPLLFSLFILLLLLLLLSHLSCILFCKLCTLRSCHNFCWASLRFP